jgi:Gpi18-like mannosyltransferase
MEQFPGGFLLVFLLPFHLGGGAALGFALRRMVQDGFKLSSLSLQLAVFLGTIVAVAFFYEWLRDLYSHPGMFLASFGFVFFLVGAALLTTVLLGEGTDGILVSLVFAGIGGLLTLIGVWMLLRTR